MQRWVDNAKRNRKLASHRHRGMLDTKIHLWKIGWNGVSWSLRLHTSGRCYIFSRSLEVYNFIKGWAILHCVLTFRGSGIATIQSAINVPCTVLWISL
jgi:hypothetical protein